MLHWADRRALLAGDIVQVIPDRRYVGFMYSYPNLIPLPPAEVAGDRGGARAVRVRLDLRRVVGPVIERDGSAVVRRSADRYVRAVTGPGLPS